VTAVVVGDVDAHKTLAPFKKYFGNIPRGNLVEDRLTREPAQNGERRAIARFPSQPHLLIGYHKGSVHDPDQPVFEMIVQLLANGRTSRFYKNLVEGKQLAQSVDADLRWPDQRYPGLVTIDAAPRAPHTTEELEAGIYAELDKLVRDPIPERELQKVRNQLEASLIERLESNDGMADELAYYQTDAGDWRYEWALRDALAKVTEADIHRVAIKVFEETNRTVATLLPPQEEIKK
jgi:predicted Zn-dependent peptidase